MWSALYLEVLLNEEEGAFFYRWRGGVYSLEYSLDPLKWKEQTALLYIECTVKPPKPTKERRCETAREGWAPWLACFATSFAWWIS